MLIEINTAKPTEINWGAVGSEEIAQNVLMLISTIKYEVAYDRTIGIRGDFVDMPLHDAIAFVTAQIYEIVDAREPRATVENVDFIELNSDGNMIFEVVIDV